MNKIFGDKAEDFVADYLVKNNYNILARNYHSRFGEIDIICQDGEQYVFVEVKARSNDKFGTGLAAISDSKIKKMIKTIYSYFEKRNLSQDSYFRLDAIEVTYHDNTFQISEHVQNIPLD